MTTFNEMGLPPLLLKALDRLQFNTPTPIQEKAIPIALKGGDILGSAQTGTGKTAAFALPIITHLMNDPQACALILTPTRELATQVAAAIETMIPVQNIKMALLIGGESYHKQFKQLQAQPRIVVGTPGRVNDHLARNTLQLGRTRFLVLDETDRMLDMGFGVQIEKIVKFLPQKRQTMLFSATLPPEIVKLSSKYLYKPERVAAGSTITAAPKIQQELIHTSDADKHQNLLDQLNQRTGSVIIFVKTKYGTEKLANKLNKLQHSADAIHGDLQQRRRDRVIRDFRDQKYRILVATDVAARGLDIPHIEHVINYDLPQCPEDYIHRIGRTARAGAEGAAVNFLTPSDASKWRAIHRLMNPGEKQERYEHPGAKKKPGGWRPDGKRRKFVKGGNAPHRRKAG